MAFRLERNISREVVLFIYVQVGQEGEVWASIEHGFGCIQHSYRIMKTKLSFRLLQYSSQGSIKEDQNSLRKAVMFMKASKTD